MDTPAKHDPRSDLRPMVRRDRHRRRGRGLAAIVLSIAAILVPALGAAAPIPVTNADFSSAGNNGSVGGGVIGGSGDALIGAGPWRGSWAGVAALLAPPTVSVGSGRAEIGGLLGINVAGILNNRGHLHQDTGAPWVANRVYRLSVDVDASATLGLDVLQSGNVGIALATGATRASRVCTTLGATPIITLLGGTTYRLTLTCATGASVSGSLHVHLFSEPSELIGASLLGSTRFDNVSLNENLLTDPGSTTPGPTGPYIAVVGTQITPNLSLTVRNLLGAPLPGIAVGFSAPTTGAGATVPVGLVLTDANGNASVTATANTITGDYEITATVAGLPLPIAFPISNVADIPAAVGQVSGSGQGAVAGTPFAAPLGLKVLDQYGNAVPNVPVSFAAPGGGAGATLAQTLVSSGADGLVQTTAVANSTVGEYQVVASVPGLGPVAGYGLVNLLDPSITTSGPGVPNQGAGINGTPFSCALLVRVTDGVGEPVEGLAVDFVAPVSGASATLTDGTSSGTSVTTHTDADGFALVEATPNGIEGSFVVGAQLKYSLAAPIEFRLRNLAENDPLMINGFDGACIPAIGLLQVGAEE